MSTLKYTVHVTTKAGDVAKVTGDQAAVKAIGSAVRAAGAHWNAKIGTWDFGFYGTKPTSDSGALRHMKV